MASKTKLSLGVTLTPFPLGAPPVPLGSHHILRCNRCRSYLNPYVEIIDNGCRWKCNICYMVCEFPSAYDYDSASQAQVPRSSKAELNSPVYEFLAPADYMSRPPQPPAYVFLLDVTYGAINSGMVATAARTILDSLDQLPNSDGRTRVAFITHDAALHFYSFANGEVKMLIVADTSDAFLPSDEQDLLVNLRDNREQIEALLGSFQGYFGQTQATSSALGPALGAALKLLTRIGGKVLVLQTAAPSAGDGAVKPRDDPKAYGTAAESQLMKPQTTWYKMLASECLQPQVCVDMFLAPSQFVDVATIGNVCKYTGGSIFYYPGFNAGKAEDAVKLASDLSAFLAKEVCFESVIRIRASQGLAINAYYGNFFLRSSDLLALPNINPDHSYTAQILLEDTITAPLVCFQTAVLHTTCHGERRIRVINSAYPASDSPEEIFDSVDQGAFVDLLSKMALEKVLNGSLEEARDALTNKMVEVARAAKALYKLGNSGQLMLPPALRLVPLLTGALLRSLPFRTGNYTPADVRAHMIALMRTVSVPQTLDLVYPYFFSLHNMDPACGQPHADTGAITMPPRLGLSSERVERHGFYVMDNGTTQILWLGSQVHPDLCQLIFGQAYADLEAGKFTLPVRENEWSQRLATILSKRRAAQPYPPTLFLVKEDSDPALKFMFLMQLVEDRVGDTQKSYTQWVHMLGEKSAA